ncbi:hypothetical protein [Mucilaginibacter terrenus]|nr:hypothetical protein [Mucilaginibacter terrenus]
MKKLFILTALLFAVSSLKAAQHSDLDSLKQKLQLIAYDSLKAPVYTEIANEYLKYDTITNRGMRLRYQNEAINYSMMALHLYSRYDDTLGLRTSFEALSKVYTSQRKFAQAKWFILQSNSISRLRNDTTNIISSLVKLANIKMLIKDYKLAMRDLNEALGMSIKIRTPQMEALVQKNYGFLYNRMKDYEKGTIAMKRADDILDSIKKDEEAKLTALQVAPDTSGSKKVKPVTKKKLLASSTKKAVRKAPVKKLVASL